MDGKRVGVRPSGRGQERESQVGIAGRFNIYNALCGLLPRRTEWERTLAAIARGLSGTPGVRGRVEV